MITWPRRKGLKTKKHPNLLIQKKGKPFNGILNYFGELHLIPLR
jgi:hypothetical protein